MVIFYANIFYIFRITQYHDNNSGRYFTCGLKLIENRSKLHIKNLKKFSTIEKQLQ